MVVMHMGMAVFPFTPIQLDFKQKQHFCSYFKFFLLACFVVSVHYS